MDWTAQLDGYCERLGPGLLAEPLNLLSNAGFLIAAGLMWHRCLGMPTGRVLAALLFVIGIGSATFHSVATRWAELADVIPIAVFILAYIFVASRDFLGLRPLLAALVALAFLPCAAATAPLFRLIPGIGTSAGYAPVPVLIFLFAWLLRATPTGRRLALGGLLLCLNITLRSLDMPLCPVWPTGTHVYWHLLNAVLLGWMIELWRRHRLEGAPKRR